MTEVRDTNPKAEPNSISQADKRAISELLGQPPGAYNEEARHVLGDPLGFVEGRPISQSEIVSSMTLANPNPAKPVV